MSQLDRRQVIRLALGGLGLPSLAAAAMRAPRAGVVAAVAAPEGKTPDFTAAFFTDPHVFAGKGSATGFARAVQHAFDPARSGAARPPELVLTGGDLAFDILKTDVAAADAQYVLFEKGLAGIEVPIHHTLGNHDLLGVDEESGLDPSHARYGKTYFLQRYGYERTYYSFDHEGWHFVVLDTLQIVDRRYRGFVDSEQLAWLEDDLAAASRPTVVVGHVPLFSNFMELTQGTLLGIPDRVSVVNANMVAEILLRHPVRLVLAGHLHIVESFRYKGVEFANLGAVSGNWWRGLRYGFEEGYGLLEFRGDQVSWRYVDYGWDAVSESAA